MPLPDVDVNPTQDVPALLAGGTTQTCCETYVDASIILPIVAIFQPGPNSATHSAPPPITPPIFPVVVTVVNANCGAPPVACITTVAGCVAATWLPFATAPAGFWVPLYEPPPRPLITSAPLGVREPF